ncbi:MAG: hypothetical protein EZS28_024473 [Streblomastix strix]|uniref:Uncharacterized protein n=1 Tax=Streblomastix strix TaxID=222440 RepID=A0A5J4VC22_9EUKA|nr:MAG: hypothetical protein EZS28_024473 [Streblomastix strix]
MVEKSEQKRTINCSLTSINMENEVHQIGKSIVLCQLEGTVAQRTPKCQDVNDAICAVPAVGCLITASPGIF